MQTSDKKKRTREAALVKSADAKINSASASRAAFLEEPIINHLSDYNGSRRNVLHVF